jgi:hypothetical protein
MESLYVETTIPSYLTARSSPDLIHAARQQITQQWWPTARSRFDLVISEVVLMEIRRGDPDMARRREELLRGLTLLRVTQEVRSLAGFYEALLGLPAKARTDVLHIAVAVAYEVDYLVTWNCKHLANAIVQRRLQKLNAQRGLQTPILVTPEQLRAPEEGDPS